MNSPSTRGIQKFLLHEYERVYDEYTMNINFILRNSITKFTRGDEKLKFLLFLTFMGFVIKFFSIKKKKKIPQATKFLFN